MLQKNSIITDLLEIEYEGEKVRIDSRDGKINHMSAE